MAAGAGSVPGPAWGGGTPSCWSAGSVQNRAGSVIGGRSTAGGSGVREHRTPGPPGWRCRYQDSPDDSPPAVPGHSIVSPVAPPPP